MTLCVFVCALTAAPAALGQGGATAAGPRCPAVAVVCPAEPVTPGEPLTFTAQVSGEEAGRLSFKWEVSAGQIVTGQGTPSVFVDTTGANGVGVVEATVEVGGLSVSCPKTASCAAPLRLVNVCNKPLDEYGNIPFEDEQARLDNFAIAVLNEPDAQGYLFCYGGRRGRAGAARARCERAKNYLVNTRDVDAGRLVTVDGGFREELTVTLYVVPAGAEPPAAYPTVD
ncbi:MAG TPA: hypothetical protein VGV38_22180, partial [Pyrinomonadaceae bacterium]|nr:hypothetical protein [Pyrinomonadaceae bacterium]